LDYVKIIANPSPDKLASARGHGLRSPNSVRLPSLKRLLIREREAKLVEKITRNGWGEDHWQEESRLRQESWSAEWTLVEEVFKERGIELVISQEIPETEGTRRAFTATFPAHDTSAPKVKGGEG
jgi:hypothetical protein